MRILGNQVQYRETYLRKEMQEVWNSFEYLIRDDLERLGFRIRAMQSEIQCIGVRKEDMNHFIQERFWHLWEEVAKEQSEKYDRRKRVEKNEQHQSVHSAVS